MTLKYTERMATKVLALGLGETALIAVAHLPRRQLDIDIVAVTPRSCVISGQELGGRLTQPELWKRHYLNDFRDYLRLRDVEIHQAVVSNLDLDNKVATLHAANGTIIEETYDIVLVASGVTNGFWRATGFNDKADYEAAIAVDHKKMMTAHNVAVIGGGGAGVSSAYNVAVNNPDATVHLFFPGDEPLPGFHSAARSHVVKKLVESGVRLHPGHRAVIPEGFACDELTDGPIEWQTGQPSTEADCVLWAVGQEQPNSAFLPSHVRNEQGFVVVDEFLRITGYDDAFAVGDVAASDAYRSSARNWGAQLVAKNIAATLRRKPLKRFQAPPTRWGSVFGTQPNGLVVYQIGGQRFRFPSWLVERVVFPILVNRMMYGGIKSRVRRSSRRMPLRLWRKFR